MPFSGTGPGGSKLEFREFALPEHRHLFAVIRISVSFG
jgi:hypothetical protein